MKAWTDEKKSRDGLPLSVLERIELMDKLRQMARSHSSTPHVVSSCGLSGREAAYLHELVKFTCYDDGIDLG